MLRERTTRMDLDALADSDRARGPMASPRAVSILIGTFAWPSLRWRTASCGAGPSTAMKVDLVDRHSGEHGVRPICDALRETGAEIAPSTYLRRHAQAGIRARCA